MNIGPSRCPSPCSPSCVWLFLASPQLNIASLEEIHHLCRGSMNCADDYHRRQRHIFHHLNYQMILSSILQAGGDQHERAPVFFGEQLLVTLEGPEKVQHFRRGSTASVDDTTGSIGTSINNLDVWKQTMKIKSPVAQLISPALLHCKILF